ncbi:early transcribed membrane protein 13, partial [Hepatocystis sp. ex Piliocolobus tephrosceles]
KHKTEKESQYYGFDGNRQYDYYIEDGEKPSTSKHNPGSIKLNNLKLTDVAKVNTKVDDVPIKTFNILVDDARQLTQRYFKTLAQTEKAYFMQDNDFIQRFVQGVEKLNNVDLSKKQEDLAASKVKLHMYKLYEDDYHNSGGESYDY